VPEPNEDMVLTMDTTATPNGEQVEINACVQWFGAEKSGMCIIDFPPLSGYEIEEDIEVLYEDLPDPSMYMTEKVNRNFVVYYNELSERKSCVKTRQNRVFQVEDLEPAMVSAQVYYAPDYLNTKSMPIPREVREVELAVCGQDGYDCTMSANFTGAAACNIHQLLPLFTMVLLSLFVIRYQ